MKLEWLNNDFFCVDGTPPFYNVNSIKWFTIREEEINSWGYPTKKEYLVAVMDTNGNNYNICRYESRIDANRELKEFLQSRKNRPKDDEKILVD